MQAPGAAAAAVAGGKQHGEAHLDPRRVFCPQRAFCARPPKHPRGMGSDGTVGANKEAVKIIAGQPGMHAQGAARRAGPGADFRAGHAT
jgi:hypothetical protein